MRDPPRILIADDNPANRDIMATRLASQGYAILTARDGEEAVRIVRETKPDLVLLDVMMPRLDGLAVCRAIKNDAALPFTPVILVTAKTETADVVRGLDSGADEYLTKPVDHAALLARVRSILRIKQLHDTVEAQSAELADWNLTLEKRVAAQLDEIERMARLKRFLSPQIAELVVAEGEDKLLESHRREVTILFCDLRGFTAFSETTAPGAVMAVLGDYHRSLGRLANEYDGTIEHFAGDGVMLIFNDPLPCPDHATRAVAMAVALRGRLAAHIAEWRGQGYRLGFGIGIAQGYATLGRIGFEGRFDYAAIGSVVNLAARLCDAAANGQILISDAVFSAAGTAIRTEPVGQLSLKGFQTGVPAYNVLGSTR